MTKISAPAFCAALLAAGAAASAPAPTAALARLAASDAVVLAVEAAFATPGSAVRLTVYDSPENFLEAPALKDEAFVGEEGLAVLSLRGLAPGDYAFVAYLDENGDRKLNKNAIGKPKEPFIFSNNVKPKLRKPTFAETRVDVANGDVVVMRLDD
jgi:uncharacterized protein (DUF2141 family)